MMKWRLVFFSYIVGFVMLYSSIILSSHIPSSFFPNKKHFQPLFLSHPTFLPRPPLPRPPQRDEVNHRKPQKWRWITLTTIWKQCLQMMTMTLQQGSIIIPQRWVKMVNFTPHRKGRRGGLINLMINLGKSKYVISVAFSKNIKDGKYKNIYTGCPIDMETSSDPILQF